MAGNYSKETNKIKFLSQEERNLIKAIHNGDIKLASRLITEDGLDVNIQDVLLRTPLLRTCYLRSGETRCTLAKILLKNGANVNIADKHHRTPLMTACMESDEEDLVQVFLTAKEVDTNLRDENGDTALMHAVRTDNVESVRALVTWKPSAWKAGKVLVDLGNYEGMYPLLLAAKQQNPDICEILVRDGDARYAEIPTFWKRYLPPECREGTRTTSSDSPFEKYRHSAQDVPTTPYRPPMILDLDPDSDDLETVNTEDEEEIEPSTSTFLPAPSRSIPSPLFRSVSPWMSAMAVTRLNKRGKTFVVKSQHRKNNDNRLGKCDETSGVDNESNSVTRVIRSVSPELQVASARSKSKDKSLPNAPEERHESPVYKNDTKNKNDEENDQVKPSLKKVDKNETESVQNPEKPNENHLKKLPNEIIAPKEQNEEKIQTAPLQEKEREEGKDSNPATKENKQEPKVKTTPKKERQSEKQRDQKSAKRENKAEHQKVSKDRKTPTKEGKSKEQTPGDESRKPEPEPKGGWIEPPTCNTEPDEQRPNKSKSKKKAYKTKGGRVIHPNAKNDPLFQKIKQAKESGANGEEVAAKRPSQQPRKTSNRRVLVP